MEFEPSVESQVRTYTQGSGEGGALESEERKSLHRSKGEEVFEQDTLYLNAINAAFSWAVA